MQLRHCENSCMSHGACDHCNLNTISGICTKRSRSQLTCILLPLLLLRFTVLGLPFPFPLSANVPVPRDPDCNQPLQYYRQNEVAQSEGLLSTKRSRSRPPFSDFTVPGLPFPLSIFTLLPAE